MTGKQELRAARARLAEAQAERERLLLALERGEMFRVGDAREVMIRALEKVRARVLALPSTLAPELADASEAEAREIVKRAIEDALAELPEDIIPLLPRPGVASTAERGDDDDGTDDTGGRSRLRRSRTGQRGKQTSASGPGIPEASAGGRADRTGKCERSARERGARRDGR